MAQAVSTKKRGYLRSEIIHGKENLSNNAEFRMQLSQIAAPSGLAHVTLPYTLDSVSEFTCPCLDS